MSPQKTQQNGVAAPAPRRQWLMGAEAFERRMPHHDGVAALWETRWKAPCSRGLYPFHDGHVDDFAPVFARLAAAGVTDGTSDAYTDAFGPRAEELTALGDAAAAAGDADGASALYLRACAMYRIARFPYITAHPRVNDAAKWRAWEAQKAVYLRAAGSWDAPVREVAVPHRHAAGNDRGEIPVYVRLPPGEEGEEEGEGDGKGKGKACPAVLLMTGLDGYRPDNTARTDEFVARGWGCVVAEVPGTADCPADPADPAAPDRLWSSVLDWMAEDGRFDMARVLVWGLSTGGYYAARAAHTHRQRIAGAVAQGAGTHYFFAEDWLDRADGHEYPFELTPALAMKHGYGSVDEYKKGALDKFSLVATGIADKPSTRLLLVNGTLDGLMPIEDSMILFEHGTPKEARFFPDALHMGYPLANSSVYPWMESVLSSI